MTDPIVAVAAVIFVSGMSMLGGIWFLAARDERRFRADLHRRYARLTERR